MKKKIIGIIAGVVVIALLAGGYWLLTRPEETPEDETPAKADNLLVFSTDDVASFSVERKDGKGFDVTVTEREGERVYNVQDYDPIFLIRSAGFDAFLSSLSTIVPQETIEESAADLAKYGLADPSVVARVTLKDGTALALALGDPAPVDNTRYAMAEGSDTVYAVGTYTALAVDKTIYDYRTPELFPIETDDSGNADTSVISRIVLVRSGEEDVILRTRTAEEEAFYEDQTLPSTYVMDSPVPGNVNDYVAGEQIITPAVGLTTSATVVEDNPADIAAYGLDGSQYLELTISGKPVRLLFGDLTEDGSQRYIMREDIPSVIAVPSSSAESILSVESEALLARLIWLYNIANVTDLYVKTPEGEHHITYKEETEDTAFEATLDGAPIEDEDSARRIYTRVLTLGRDGKLDELPAGEPEYVITIKLTNGKETKMELTAANDRHYSIRLDGQDLYFYCGIKSIESLVDGINTVAAGGELDS